MTANGRSRRSCAVDVRDLGGGPARVAAAATDSAGVRAGARRRRVARGAYLVRTMGCNDCHTPWKMGPQRPGARHVARADRPPRRPGDAAAAGAAAGPVGLGRRRHQHRVRRTLGRQLHREPHARPGDRPRQLDRGDVHRDDADRTARGQGPAVLPPMPYPISARWTTRTSRRSSRTCSRCRRCSNRVPAPVDPPEATGAVMARRMNADGSRAAVVRAGAGRDVGCGPSWRRALAATTAPPLAPRRAERHRPLRGRPAGRRRPRNRPFSPQYPLWSDGAGKRAGSICRRARRSTRATPAEWSFPSARGSGRSSRFDGRKVETRFLWQRRRPMDLRDLRLERGADGRMLAPEEGVAGVVEVAPGRGTASRRSTDCRACHGEAPGPLGLQRAPALDRSRSERDPRRAAAPGMIDAARRFDEGRLAPARPRAALDSAADRSASAADAVALGYLAANCGSCHNRSGEIDARPVAEAQRPARRRCHAPALLGYAHDVAGAGRARGRRAGCSTPRAPGTSAMLARMRSRRPSSQMPPLGTVLRDDQAIDAIAKWLATDLAKPRVASR